MPDLHDLLSAASAEVAVTPPGAEAAVATARARRRRRTGVVALALVAAVGGGVALLPGVGGDQREQVVVAVAPSLPALGAAEVAGDLTEITLGPGEADLTLTYEAGGCTRLVRVDVLETSTEVRVRAVVDNRPPAPQPPATASGCALALSYESTTAALAAPLGERRLIAVDPVERVVRDRGLPAGPAPVFPPPGTGMSISSFNAVRTDGRGLLAVYDGCLDDDRLEVRESLDEVRVRLVGDVCARLVGRTAVQVRAELVQPLGDRPLLMVTRQGQEEVQPFDGRTLLEPVLPDGFENDSFEIGYASARGTTWTRSWRDPRPCAPGASGFSVTQGPGTDIAMRVTNWPVVGRRDVNGIPAELRRGNTGEYALLWSTEQGRVGVTEGRVTTPGCSHVLTEGSLLALARGLRVP